MKSAVITQTNYIPWKGYFKGIRDTDLFITLDSVQYTRRDWRNRNQIYCPHKGAKWISIPVNSKGKYSKAKIFEIETLNQEWKQNHLEQIRLSYKNAPYFKETFDFLTNTYKELTNENNLSRINCHLIQKICKFMDISLTLKRSTDLFTIGELDQFEPSQRLLELCLKENVTKYYSGPAAKNYLNENLFKAEGIEVQYFSHENYPIYQQLSADKFNHFLSIIDLFMMVGPKDAKNYF